MTEKDRKKAAKDFAARWEGKGYEKGQSQQFWMDLLINVYGVENISEFISFEDQVQLDHTSFIDAYISSTRVMIEQKSIGKDLRKPIRQADGSLLTPFQQAKRYVTELPLSQHPRWIVTCNFAEFLVYDMEKPNGEPEQIYLKDLEKDYYRLQFLTDSGSEMLKKEMEISLKAGELVGKLYDAILKQYKDPESPQTLKSLNMLCVRLVFCLYAEDSGVFGEHRMFGKYLSAFHAKDVRKALIELFKVLDTEPEKRDPYMEEELAAFPYVNGGLFADEDIEIPRFTDEIVNLLINDASEGFDWADISPTIFGAVFESTLNPETRRAGGMHYTSIENIHKLIDPLFLDDLKAEFQEIAEIPDSKRKPRERKIELFKEKLSKLKFLDPACGSGNFLTETYISLRRLENEALKLYYKGQMVIGLEYLNPISVHIDQFYGIEINDFAVTVAKTALWIAESQMMKETEDIVHMDLDFLPLKSYANITEGNALRMDWEEVVPKEELSYIMGNPPFVGYTLQSKEQKKDILNIYVDENGTPYKTAGKIDYVAAWYFKASQLMLGTNIRTAFVSTNSITQGEQVAGVWRPLYTRFGIHIDFAYHTFRWDSEASIKAHVHCIIVGFSIANNIKNKILFDDGIGKIVGNINPYLIPSDNIFVESRGKSICKVPNICKGFQATDNGYLILTKEEKDNLIRKEPDAKKWIRPYSMGVEFINRIPRYCLWLVDITPNELRKTTEIRNRVESCKKWRENATKTGDAYKLKDTPHLFRPCKQFKDSIYIAIPLVSSSQRKYMPMDYIRNGMIPGNNLFCVFDAELYHFGVLMSNVHMAWIRAIGGYLKSDWRYSKDIVYNNFPWPTPTPEQRAKIEETAQAILDARALYPDSSLADLYDELTMPKELRKAHQNNDRAVMTAYGFDLKMLESECVAELIKMYKKLSEAKG
ncbi:MAG: class I SAM-dependent DNA methyltransferase [Firmicutes bacterium]|nr:class I SAM-dependent DNA methyltransferase [Bacillota bacterium]